MPLNDHLLVLSPICPGYISGDKIAVKSSLDQYVKYYKEITYIVLLKQHIDIELCQKYDNVKFIPLNINKGSAICRYIKSKFNMYPAISQQYLKSHIIKFVQAEIQWQFNNYNYYDIIVEMVAPAALLHKIGHTIHGLKFIVRSHDVLSSAFEELSRTGNIIKNYAWRSEIKRIYMLEDWLMRNATKFYAISNSDYYDYKYKYNKYPDGILGVDIDLHRYKDVNNGSMYKIIHIGGADARKIHGIHFFIRNIWPIVREVYKEAELHLGGKGSETWNYPELGIYGHGFIENEVSFLSQGKIFINPQLAGSGIKLKSINAMAAQRALVSTFNGVRGIPGKNGQDFLCSDNPQGLANHILRLIQYPDFAYKIGRSGSLVVQQYFTNTTNDGNLN
ncbi:MAG: glycosyltransferase family 4 protein [Desulfovermiculus sp.]|nr:glycosyltransferase family 4 protein [Desulfovermiculus sp.]